ncbi:MAG: DUF433 domain-containing protein [Chloroflexi bacterium]|nr:DUF433 domain-containing protein [Chloroflexota bacterium]
MSLAMAMKYIEHNSRVLGGEPIIRGTRVPVHSIVIACWGYGDIERVRKAYPRVSVEAIHEALEYYRQHKQEIDSYIAENEAAGYAS